MALPERREHVAIGEERSIDGSKHGRHAVGEMTVANQISNRGHAAGKEILFTTPHSAAPHHRTGP